MFGGSLGGFQRRVSRRDHAHRAYARIREEADDRFAMSEMGRVESTAEISRDLTPARELGEPTRGHVTLLPDARVVGHDCATLVPNRVYRLFGTGGLDVRENRIEKRVDARAGGGGDDVRFF